MSAVKLELRFRGINENKLTVSRNSSWILRNFESKFLVQIASDGIVAICAHLLSVQDGIYWKTIFVCSVQIDCNQLKSFLK